MAEVFFFIAGIGAIAGALGVVLVRNPFYTVLSLVFHLLSLAALFLLLRAEFVAAAQVVVYAGAVMVLYVFVVAYVGGTAPPVRPAGGPALRVGSAVFAGALAAELLIAVLGSALKCIDSQAAPYERCFGTPAAIGELLLTRFLFPFEAASFLLLMAAVGAVVLARRRRGLVGVPDPDLQLALPRPRPADTGTRREAVSGQLPAPQEVQEPVPAAAAAERDERGGW